MIAISRQVVIADEEVEITAIRAQGNGGQHETAKMHDDNFRDGETCRLVSYETVVIRDQAFALPGE